MGLGNDQTTSQHSYKLVKHRFAAIQDPYFRTPHYLLSLRPLDAFCSQV